MLFQEWESMEALMGHFDTDHMDVFLQQLPDLVSGEIVTRRYAVQAVEEEEAVAVESEAPAPIIH
jgi:quinol monooxygenase YgiN